MRFLQGLSIAETAQVLGRSEGAVKQLQLRGVRNLAKLLPEGLAVTGRPRPAHAPVWTGAAAVTSRPPGSLSLRPTRPGSEGPSR